MIFSKDSALSKTISFLLVVVLSAALFPAAAFADEDDKSSQTESTSQTNIEENETKDSQNTTLADETQEINKSGVDFDSSSIDDTPSDTSEGAEIVQRTLRTTMESSKTTNQENEAKSKVAAADEVEVAATRAAVINFDGFYNIASKNKKSVVFDIEGESTANKANVQQYSFKNSPHQRFKIEHVKDGYYCIRSAHSDKVLTVADGKKKSGTNVYQYAYNESNAQLWQIVPTGGNDGTYQITSKLSKKLVLSVKGDSAKSGANIIVSTPNKSNGQKFYLIKKSGKTIKPGVYTVNSKVASDKVLDIADASNSNGGNLQICSPNSNLAQKFSISYDSSTGYYKFRSAHSGRYLSVAGASTKNRANVYQWKSNKSNAQKWTIEKSGSNYVVRSACSGKVLDVRGGLGVNGANVQQLSYNKSNAQLWSFSSTNLVSNSVYLMKSALGKVVDVYGGSELNNANIQMYKSNGALWQKFYIRLVSGGYYRIECINSGKVLTVSGNNVVLYTNGTKDTQLWKPSIAGNGQFYWINKATKKVLDVADASTKNCANVQVHPKNGSAAQKWSISTTRLLPNDVFTFKSALNKNKVIDILGGSGDNGAVVQLYDSNNSSAQKFQVNRLSSGNIYQIKNIKSNKALDVASESYNSSNGAGPVSQWSLTGSNNQKWKVKYAGGGYFTFYSQLGNKKSVINVTGASTANGTRIEVYPANNTKAQKFKPVVVEGFETVNMPVTLNRMTDLQAAYSYSSWNDVKTMLNPDTWNESNWEYLQHADLRGYSGMTAGQLNSFIASSSNGRAGVLYNQGAAIVAVSKKYNINEVYILAHAILESAWGTSRLAQHSYYNGVRVYNLFGYGAYDTNPDNGRKYAYDCGWTSVEKSLSGTMGLISSGYIYRSAYEQPTLYMMKWDLLYTQATGRRGSHQYATGITWAQSIAWLMGSCYSMNGKSPNVKYIVPRYK